MMVLIVHDHSDNDDHQIIMTTVIIIDDAEYEYDDYDGCDV